VYFLCTFVENFYKMISPLVILSLSAQHIIIVAIILLLLFGGKKIPELMKGVGSGIKEFKDAVKEDDKKQKILTKLKTLINYVFYFFSLGNLQQIC